MGLSPFPGALGGSATAENGNEFGAVGLGVGPQNEWVDNEGGFGP